MTDLVKNNLIFTVTCNLKEKYFPYIFETLTLSQQPYIFKTHTFLICELKPKVKLPYELLIQILSFTPPRVRTTTDLYPEL